jgi:hypothetical protein
MRITAWARAGVTAILFLGIAGCGDDDDGSPELGGVAEQGSVDGAGSDDDDGGEVDGGQALDLCTLLEESEVEAEFGERGRAAEGYEEFESCVWEVGDQSVAGTGSVTVSEYPTIPGQSLEDNFAGFEELADDPVDIDGLGEEAYFEHDATAFDDRSLGVVFEHTFVYFRTDSVFLSVSAFFGPGVDGVEDRLVVLAEHVLDRL